jgi:hypothetical protein
MDKERRDALFAECVRYVGLGLMLYEVITKDNHPYLLCAILSMMGLSRMDFGGLQWLNQFGKLRSGAGQLLKLPLKGANNITKSDETPLIPPPSSS